MQTRRKLLLIIVASVSVAFLLHTLTSDGWSNRSKLRADLEALQTENDEIGAEVKRLRFQIDALRRRPAVQERIVRDELGYIKPHDIVLELGRTNSKN